MAAIRNPQRPPSRAPSKASSASAVPASASFDSRRGVVIGAALTAMLVAAVTVWLAIGAVPDLAKSLPVEQVLFVSASGAPLAEVDGDALKRVADALRTRNASMLQLDLAGLAGSIKQIPWVREATVRRQFPDSIVVSIEEHKPVARWMTAPASTDASTDEASTLVNSYGDVFIAVIADDRRDLLPRLAGPEGTSAEVLTRYAALLAPLKTIDRAPAALVLTARRAWQLTLDNGSAIELGRTDADQRIARFIRTYTELSALQVAGAVVDMRYQAGLTIRNANGVGGTKPATDDAATKRST